MAAPIVNLPTAYLNGIYLPLDEARISPLDRGFLFGDGIYEVIPCYNGNLFRLKQHLDRMLRSLTAIQLDSPHSEAEWARILDGLVQHNGGGHQSVYLQISRGAPNARDHRFPDQCPPPCSPTPPGSTTPTPAPWIAKPASTASPARTSAGPAATSRR